MAESRRDAAAARRPRARPPPRNGSSGSGSWSRSRRAQVASQTRPWRPSRDRRLERARATPVDPSASATRPRPWSSAGSAMSGIEARCVAQASSHVAASSGRPAAWPARTPVTTKGVKKIRSPIARARSSASRHSANARVRSPACRATSARPQSGGTMSSISSLSPERSASESSAAASPDRRDPGRRSPARSEPARAPRRQPRSAMAWRAWAAAPTTSAARPRHQRRGRAHHVRAMGLLDRVGVAKPLGRASVALRA